MDPSSPAAPRLRPRLAAGAASAAAGLGLFLVVHAIWILPIWFVALPGLGIALLGGLAVGWAYHEASPRLPASRARRALLVAAGMLLTLVPAQVLSSARGQVSREVLANLPLDLALRGVAELLLTASLAGALLALALGFRSRRVVGACAVGALAYALGVGHNVPFIALPSAMATMWAVMVAVTLLAAGVLVGLDRAPGEAGS